MFAGAILYWLSWAQPFALLSLLAWIFVADSPRAVIAGGTSLSYAGNMLAKPLAGERGFSEALLTASDGRAMEVQQSASWRGVLAR
jgi:branched-subunit amino acid aminotransferase/4-amino-4-deoxychorismate lyase